MGEAASQNPKANKQKAKTALHRFMEQLDSVKIEGKTINSITYDSLPLWWFYKIRFMRDSVPSQFDNFDTLLRYKKASPRRRWLHIQQKKATGKILAKGLVVNEKLKRKRANRKIPDFLDSAKQDGDGGKNQGAPVFFLVHSIALDIDKENKTFAIDRIESVHSLAKKDEALDPEVLVVDAMSKPVPLRATPFKYYFPRFTTQDIQDLATHTAPGLNKEWQEFKTKLAEHFQNKSEEDAKIFSLAEPALDFFFSSELIQVTITYLETFKRLLGENGAKALVIYAPAGILDRCAIKAADLLGIPTISLFPGMGMSSTPWTYGKDNFFLVNSIIERDQLIKLGASPKNVQAIGPITFSGLQDYQKRAAVPTTGKKSILFCTGPLVQENASTEEDYARRMKQYLTELMELDDEYEIIIKPHPLEKQQYITLYKQIIKELSATNMRVIEGGLGKKVLYELIADCDLFVCFFSTALFEASLLNKPVILIDLYDRNRIDMSGKFFDNSEAVLKVAPDGEVLPVIQKVLGDASFRKKLERQRKAFNELFCYKADANAPQRAVDFIKKKLDDYK